MRQPGRVHQLAQRLPARSNHWPITAEVRDDSDVDRAEIQTAFDDVLDQAILFHGFADYMRDYELFIYATADPRTGIRP